MRYRIKLFPIRRWIAGDVHDWRPEKILRGHEEDGQEETGESHPKATGKSVRLIQIFIIFSTHYIISTFQWRPQAIVFGIVTNKKFDMIIMIFIGLNMLTMTLDHYGQSEMWVFALENLNMGFICIFTTESVLKIFALRQHYFMEPWNNFDFVVVILSILGKFDRLPHPRGLRAWLRWHLRAVNFFFRFYNFLPPFCRFYWKIAKEILVIH